MPVPQIMTSQVVSLSDSMVACVFCLLRGWSRCRAEVCQEKLRLGWRSFWRGLPRRVGPSFDFSARGQRNLTAGSRQPAVQWLTGLWHPVIAALTKIFRRPSFSFQQPTAQPGTVAFSLSHGQPEPNFLSLGSFMLGGRLNHKIPLVSPALESFNVLERVEKSETLSFLLSFVLITSLRFVFLSGAT